MRSNYTALAIICFAAIGLMSCGLGDAGSPSPPPRGPSLRVVAGADVTDTIQARPTQALTVEVRDSAGQPMSGVVVRFDALPRLDSLGRERTVILVGAIESQFPGSSVADSTDVLGEAQVLVRFGTLVGPARVATTAPSLGLADTARFTVIPGNAARIVFSPADTAIGVGKTYAPNAAAGDRFLNRRSDPVTYSGASSICQVNAAGVITTLAFGRCAIAARSGAVLDSARASVVPVGTLVVLWYPPDGRNPSIGTVALDGSNRRTLSAVASNDVYPTTSRGGSVTAFRDQSRLFIVNASGARHSLLAGIGGFDWEGWPRLSRDSSWVYFAAGNNGEAAIHRVRPDGTGFERIVLPGSPRRSTQPDPSPDGTRVAFVGDGRIQIHTLGSSAPSISGPNGALPRWSPTGDQIAFIDGSIYVVSADATNARRVSPGGFDYAHTSGLDWSADGRWIIVRGAAMLELIEVATSQSLPLIFSQRAFQPAFLR